jgi:hypothetical protein
LWALCRIISHGHQAGTTGSPDIFSFRVTVFKPPHTKSAPAQHRHGFKRKNAPAAAAIDDDLQKRGSIREKEGIDLN